jgi:hypothetical protein
MDNRMRLHFLMMAAVLVAPATVRGQESYKIELLKDAPPPGVSAAIRAELNPQGYRLLNEQGKSYADFWLRKAIPASGKPAGAKGVIQFPILAEGELLGALHFPGEGHDYRDQAIARGTYTLRYGLQPVNGDHLGVSLYRDYMLLLPSSKDNGVADLSRKKLQDESAEAAGTSHPSVLMLLGAPESAATAAPSVVHDAAKNTWGVVIPLKLAVKGSAAAETLYVQLVLVGAAMN